MAITQEQEELDRSIRVTERRATGVGDANREGKSGDDGSSDDDEASPTATAAFRKLKKLSKFSETRKDGVVKLEQRLLEK
ncbi:hypothetical_protein (plasmid) [Leishmania braziliensis MHOM/BR/75/M2904]|uniref:Hypothetical_protein n=1 Tax=Leishmania braziliensis MHOM/BR/75/M2904 TaxID=420245 RepID=A0A3P3Z7C4_LEIBR|nr:hypothetical_protein [Leishmania braziliensis MHOM/BR/75/M2904]